ncbi:MAG: isochorismatase family protein [Candidatus Lokiarchaeota archaeon]|nr:isochorismatase family protein [Candidatus Harpocratesius repetitus]
MDEINFVKSDNKDENLKSAIIIIDLIQDFSPIELNPNAPLPVNQLTLKKRTQINHFIQWCSENQIVIVFIRDCHFPEQFHNSIEIPHALFETQGRDFMKWLFLPEKYIEFEKYGYNALQNVEFQKFLMKNRFDIIGVFGTSTGVCVYQTWNSLRKFTNSCVYLLADGCTDMFPKRHEQTISKLKHFWPECIILFEDYKKIKKHSLK